MSVRLYYLELHGRAELTRMLLNSQGIEFVDTVMSGEELGKWGPTGVAEFHAVPALEIDNKSFIESRAIEKYVLGRAGVSPSTPHEHYLNDSLLGVVDDIRNKLINFIFWDSNLPGAQEWIRSSLGFSLQIIEKRINEHGFFVNDRLQHADWALFELLYDYLLQPKYAEFGRAYLEGTSAKLLQWADQFLARDERLSNYLASRVDRPI